MSGFVFFLALAKAGVRSAVVPEFRAQVEQDLISEKRATVFVVDDHASMRSAYAKQWPSRKAPIPKS